MENHLIHRFSQRLQVVDTDGDGKFRAVRGDKVVLDGRFVGQQDPSVREEMRRLGFGGRPLWRLGALESAWQRSSIFVNVRRWVAEGDYEAVLSGAVMARDHGFPLITEEQWNQFFREAASSFVQYEFAHAAELAVQGKKGDVMIHLLEIQKVSRMAGLPYDKVKGDQLFQSARENCEAHHDHD
jgi:hypothetical protein